MTTESVRVAALLLLLALPVASSQVAVPDFGSRGDVPQELLAEFSGELRRALGELGLEAGPAELITPGIAGSLEPQFALLIAELEGVRYAVSGEIARAPEGQAAPYLVNLIVVDRELERASDLISRPLPVAGLEVTAASLARTVGDFVQQAATPPPGDAGLFVSSEPGEAEVYLDGVRVGVTSQIDVLMLAPGRYQLELRKEGFLPETRAVELRPADTTFVHVLLAAVSGGSIQVSTVPSAEVFLDGASYGFSPVTLPAHPGVQTVRLERDGFQPLVASVPVRNYRVSRLELQLEPLVEPLLFWPVEREYLVYVDGELQPGGFARNARPGLVRLELRRGAESRSYSVVLPSRGAFELDLETGEVRSLSAQRGNGSW